ncbi:hypothetical protein IW140_005257 [Coemansia sp. RSA 1813]|nr:hypothetical protein EV178_004277 [Coemansia sp. RSA 1646]KAJ1770848.1 hypothetical protein LPJ74_002834 [Coemansia sp. RSA 1843]KAJ2565621.1 hypothetical protein IW140_005257 [Coemansia sp. RSA 1813]
MDEFINTVNSQDFPLNGFDELVSSMYTPFYYWYENKAPGKAWTTFMPSDMLCSSFYRALQDFPILAGRFKTDKNSRKYVSVDKSNLNMPVYTDSSWDIDFKQVKDAGFSTRLLPEDFSEACGIPTVSVFATTDIKLGIFHVRRFKDFSGVVVFASISHAIIDGYGFFAFMNRWAEISKSMQENMTKQELELPIGIFIHDRSMYSKCSSQDTDALDDLTLASSADGSAITRFLARLSVDKRNRVIKSIIGSTRFICCSFHVTTPAIKAFRETVQKYAPQGIDFSINDILVALVTMAISQSIYKISAKKQNRFVPRMTRALFGSSDSVPIDTLTSIIANMRTRISNPHIKDYVGNLSYPRYILSPQALIQDENILENISAIATSVRTVISRTDEKYVGQLNYLLNSESDIYMRQAMYHSRIKNRLVVSNVSKSSYYKTDFGAGIPTFVRVALHSFPNTVVVMCGHPDDGGYNLVMTLEKEMAEMVVQNKLWMDLVDSYNIDV